MIVTAWLILFLMWSAAVPEALQRYGVAHPEAMTALYDIRVAFWFVRELIWWYVVAILVGLLLCFALTSEMGRWASAWRGR